MLKNTKSRTKFYSLLSVLLLSFFIYPSGDVSAAQINTSQNSNTGTVDNISPAAVYSKYVTVYRTTTTFPASSITHVEWDGSFKYSGRLDRFDYAYDPDAGLYFATYKGNITIQ